MRKDRREIDTGLDEAESSLADAAGSLTSLGVLLIYGFSEAALAAEHGPCDPYSSAARALTLDVSAVRANRQALAPFLPAFGASPYQQRGANRRVRAWIHHPRSPAVLAVLGAVGVRDVACAVAGSALASAEAARALSGPRTSRATAEGKPSGTSAGRACPVDAVRRVPDHEDVVASPGRASGPGAVPGPAARAAEVDTTEALTDPALDLVGGL